MIAVTSTPSMHEEITSIGDISLITFPCVTLVVNEKINPSIKLAIIVDIKNIFENLRNKIFWYSALTKFLKELFL